MKFSKKIFLSKILLLVSPFAFSKENVESKNLSTNRMTQLETDEVLVWKSTISPKEPLKFHRHDKKRIVVALTDTDLTVIDDSGKSKFYHWPKGTAHLLLPDKPGELHSDINGTNQTMEIMVIQFKK